MAKYAPYLRSLARGATLLTPGYSATEGSIGIAASLLEAVRPLPPSRPSMASRPDMASSGPAADAARGTDGLQAAGKGDKLMAVPAAQPAGLQEEAFVLLPHIGCFYELLDLETGETCRWGPASDASFTRAAAVATAAATAPAALPPMPLLLLLLHARLGGMCC